MFTAEIKINGTLIGHVYGRNLDETKNGRDHYTFEYYAPENPGDVVTGKVWHKYDDGMRKLLIKILQEVEKKCSTAKEKRSPSRSKCQKRTRGRENG